jgi:hypothetical protein
VARRIPEHGAILMTGRFLTWVAAAALLGVGVVALECPEAVSIAAQTFAPRSLNAAVAPVASDMKRFVGVAAAPLAAVPGGSAFATLYVSAPVVIAGADAYSAHVTARLWVHGDPADPGPLYTAPMGVEVGRLNATLSVNAIPSKVSKGWTLVEINGYLAAGTIVDTLDPIWEKTEFDYEFVCSDCHTPHAAAEYSSMQWGIIMARMGKFAKLQPDEELFILKWLQTASGARESRG